MFAFEKTSPESQGIPSEAIRSFAERLAKMDAIHSFMLVRHDKLIAEGITPIKRWGEGEDVAKCVFAAASGLLDFGTGTVLNADGGFHLRRL